MSRLAGFLSLVKLDCLLVLKRFWALSAGQAGDKIDQLKTSLVELDNWIKSTKACKLAQAGSAGRDEQSYTFSK